MAACTCGHAEEDHGGDPKYPGSTACQETDGDCVAYEPEGEEEEWDEEEEDADFYDTLVADNEGD